MEQFSVQHAGALNIAHSFDCSPNVVNAVKELNKLALVLVVGWVTVTLIRNTHLLQQNNKN